MSEHGWDDAPWISVLDLRTPTLPPACTTNTMIVGTSHKLVIDPATPFADEQGRLLAKLETLHAEGATCMGVLLTHHHRDHVGSALTVAERFNVPIFAHAHTHERLRLEHARTVDEHHTFALGGGVEISLRHTPGHAPGHLVAVEKRSRVAYVGDMVAGEGSILIDPDDDGDMVAYLASLAVLAAQDYATVVPSHGPRLTSDVFARTANHRLMREAKVLTAIAATDGTWDSVLGHAYGDVPTGLQTLARKSLRAHVNKLVDEGRVRAHRGGLKRTS